MRVEVRVAGARRTKCKDKTSAGRGAETASGLGVSDLAWNRTGLWVASGERSRLGSGDREPSQEPEVWESDANDTAGGPQSCFRVPISGLLCDSSTPWPEPAH